MLRHVMSCLVVVALVPPALADQKVRVYNQTNSEVRVKILHTNASVRWTEVVAPASQSRLGRLLEGDRILAVYDASTGELLLSERFLVSDRGVRIILTGTAPGIRVLLSYHAPPVDP